MYSCIHSASYEVTAQSHELYKSSFSEINQVAVKGYSIRKTMWGVTGFLFEIFGR